MIARWLSSSWYQQHWIRWLLWPFSCLYRFVIALRKFGYNRGLLKTTRFSVPVIVVGNISVGGTGKSPLTAAIALHLKQQGLHPGLVSRGYGGTATQWPQSVTSDSDPSLVGDEPVMLVQQTACPMVVGPDRVAAVRALLHQHDCDVIISDDGLQHYALARDIEIAVMDGARRCGNGLCLPAGPLREPQSRLSTVDFVVCQGDALPSETAMQLQISHVTLVKDPSRIIPLADLINTPVHAIAGIGHPERFFTALEQRGLQVIPHAFPDHHRYVDGDMDFADGYPILMTAKDAVKYRQWSDDRHWCVDVKAVCPQSFWQQLSGKLAVRQTSSVVI